MNIGISVCSLYPVENPRTGAQYMIERAAMAKAAGLDSLFVGDHHVTPAPYYQNNVILARMLAEITWSAVVPVAQRMRMIDGWLKGEPIAGAPKPYQAPSLQLSMFG